MARTRVSLPERLTVAGLLALFALLAVLSMRSKSPTFDETTHLAAGISYVQTGDYRMNPEHPALPKLLAGIAATIAGANARAEGEAWDRGEQWDFARETLYDGDVSWKRMLFAGRLPMVLLGVLLGMALWWWVRAMIGQVAALGALVLYAFSPSFLAHTRLVTTDVPLTLFVVVTTACLMQAWRTGRIAWIVVAAIGIALTMLTKFSAFSYAPVWALLAIVPSENRPLRKGLAHLAVLVAVAVGLSELLVFICYGFATDFATIRSIGMGGRGVDPSSMSLIRRIPYEIMASIPWPSAEFARGMKDVILYTEAGHPVYALGMRADRGWWWQSFLTLGVKATLPLLALAVWGVVSVIRNRALRRRELLFVLAPPALVLFTNVAANLGLGVRHLLPMFPFLIVLAVWPLAVAGRGLRAIVVALLALWHVAGTLTAHPHYLPYFNEAARWTGGGYRLLGDSNLDWGQDLSLAANRLRGREVGAAILCYFGTASPFVEGIEWQLLPPTARGKRDDPWTVLPAEGPQWLVMSATNLQGIYYRATGGGAPYPWLEDVVPDEIVGDGAMFLYDISTNPEVQRGLYTTYARHQLRDEAEGALRRACALVPADNEHLLELADLLIDKGDIVAAQETLFQAPNPDVPVVLKMLVLREELGLEVRSLYRRALEVFPHDTEVKNAVAWHLQENDEELDVALELANGAVEWEPGDLYYRDTRGMVYLKLGDAWKALEDFDYSLAQPGGDLAEIRWHRVLALIEAGRADEAVREAKVLSGRSDLPDELHLEIETLLQDAEP